MVWFFLFRFYDTQEMKDRLIFRAGKFSNIFYQHIMDSELKRDKCCVGQSIVESSWVIVFYFWKVSAQNITFNIQFLGKLLIETGALAFLIPNFNYAVDKIFITIFVVHCLHPNFYQIIWIIKWYTCDLGYRCPYKRHNKGLKRHKFIFSLWVILNRIRCK